MSVFDRRITPEEAFVSRLAFATHLHVEDGTGAVTTLTATPSPLTRTDGRICVTLSARVGPTAVRRVGLGGADFVSLQWAATAELASARALCVGVSVAAGDTVTARSGALPRALVGLEPLSREWSVAGNGDGTVTLKGPLGGGLAAGLTSVQATVKDGVATHPMRIEGQECACLPSATPTPVPSAPLTAPDGTEYEQNGATVRLIDSGHEVTFYRPYRVLVTDRTAYAVTPLGVQDASGAIVRCGPVGTDKLGVARRNGQTLIALLDSGRLTLVCDGAVTATVSTPMTRLGAVSARYVLLTDGRTGGVLYDWSGAVVTHRMLASALRSDRTYVLQGKYLVSVGHGYAMRLDLETQDARTLASVTTPTCTVASFYALATAYGSRVTVEAFDTGERSETDAGVGEITSLRLGENGLYAVGSKGTAYFAPARYAICQSQSEVRVHVGNAYGVLTLPREEAV